jgi:hypothetical protein
MSMGVQKLKNAELGAQGTNSVNCCEEPHGTKGSVSKRGRSITSVRINDQKK